MRLKVQVSSRPREHRRKPIECVSIRLNTVDNTPDVVSRYNLGLGFVQARAHYYSHSKLSLRAWSNPSQIRTWRKTTWQEFRTTPDSKLLSRHPRACDFFTFVVFYFLIFLFYFFFFFLTLLLNVNYGPWKPTSIVHGYQANHPGNTRQNKRIVLPPLRTRLPSSAPRRALIRPGDDIRT